MRTSLPTAIDELERVLLRIDRVAAAELLGRVRQESEPLALVEGLIVPTLERIGTGWERGTIALSQVYMTGRICEELLADLLPPGRAGGRDQPRMAIAVLEDHHLLGKRIVTSILRASGFTFCDYGRTGVDDLVRRVVEDRIEVLLVSTLMLPSALRIGQLRARFDEQGSRVRIVVGGAPFRYDDELWREVGADAMCRDASEIVATLSTLDPPSIPPYDKGGRPRPSQGTLSGERRS